MDAAEARKGDCTWQCEVVGTMTVAVVWGKRGRSHIWWLGERNGGEAIVIISTDSSFKTFC